MDELPKVMEEVAVEEAAENRVFWSEWISTCITKLFPVPVEIKETVRRINALRWIMLMVASLFFLFNIAVSIDYTFFAGMWNKGGNVSTALYITTISGSDLSLIVILAFLLAASVLKSHRMVLLRTVCIFAITIAILFSLGFIGMILDIISYQDTLVDSRDLAAMITAVIVVAIYIFSAAATAVLAGKLRKSGIMAGVEDG
jgi:hypothetical protein